MMCSSLLWSVKTPATELDDVFFTIAVGEDIPRRLSVRTPATELDDVFFTIVVGEDIPRGGRRGHRPRGLDFSWSCFLHGRCPTDY